MLYFERIDINKGIDLTKSNKRKECMICHYWFFNRLFKFQDSVKKLSRVIRYVPDQYKTQEMFDKAILENGGILESVPDRDKNMGYSY